MLHKEKYKDYDINIDYDQCNLDNPRDWDNLGTMVCFHKRCCLGDKHDYNSDNYSSWDEMEKDNCGY